MEEELKDTGLCGICGSCKEWSTVMIDEQGDETSDCCGYPIYGETC